jgi:hypothetical protein
MSGRGVVQEEILLGAQRPALWTAPPRHREKQSDCKRCDDQDYRGGCGNFVSEEVLDWARNYWPMDDWQEWSLTEGMGVKPNRRWTARESCVIVPRQNGKNTILEVRELGGLFVLGEKKIIHTAHQFSTAAEQFARCLEIIDNNADLSKWLKGNPSKTHGMESITLRAKPTLIFGPGNSQVRASFDRKLEFHARTGKKSRGFTCNCLVYDEAMYLTAEQIGASRPTLRAVANHQIWLAGSAGLKDSMELATYHERILEDEQTLFGAEWGGLVMHKPECPRDKVNGRRTNDYVVGCTLHDDRDSPLSWAKSNPAYGVRIERETFENEIVAMRDQVEFNRELLNVGEWPDKDAAWSIVDRDQWEFLTVPSLGTVPPIVLAVDVDEDGRTAAICAAWCTGGKTDYRVIVYNPADCIFEGTDGVLSKLKELYKGEYRVVAIVVPKEGPAAGIGDDIEKLYRDKVIRPGPSDQAAAFAFFTQKVKENVIGHAPKAKAEALYEALGSAETRIVGDAGKTVKRADARVPVSPASTAILAAWMINKKRRGYNLANSIG